MRAVARTLIGLALGMIAGLAVTLAIAAYRATVQGVYVHSQDETVGWLGLPVAVAVVIGVWLGMRLEARRFWRLTVTLLASLAAGAGAGAAVGAILGTHTSAPWAGGLMGAGVSVLVLAGITLAGSLRGSARAAGLVLLLVAGACSSSAPAPDGGRVAPAPQPDEVDAVIFLLGDPGLARADQYPILPRMKQDIERWSHAVGPDGDIMLLVLGDILYPEGLHPDDHPSRDDEVRRLTDQIDLISGPWASRAEARAIFLAGNHDWGQRKDFAGAVRLVRLQGLFETWPGPAAGRVFLEPEAGTGGPGVVDLGERARVVLLDTAWWLLGSDPGEEDAVIARLRRAFETAGDRRLILAAHHPLRTGGPHGAVTELGRNLGLRFLLNKAGILLQDLRSRPYSELRARLQAVFAEVRRPDVYAGGHEHSLQVFATGETESRRALVVGSGSKLTSVGLAPGMLFGRSEPGYGKIFVLRDGRLHLRLEAAPADFLSCAGSSPSSCMRDGVDAYRTVWGETIEVPG